MGTQVHVECNGTQAGEPKKMVCALGGSCSGS